MIKVYINGGLPLEVDHEAGTLNGNAWEGDIVKIKEGVFHILYKNKSFLAEITDTVPEEKKISIRINGRIYEARAEDRLDELLKNMGLSAGSSGAGANLKAPMPGLVLEVKIKAGEIIQKGDALVVLEAMKMENTLKALGAGKIEKICVQKGEKVEKNQLLIEISNKT